MSVLGRGLASLIPRRGRDDAENILEQIDSMEAVSEEPEHVRVLRNNRAGEEAPQEEPETKEARPKARSKRLSVVEEQDEPVAAEEEEQEPTEEPVLMPSRPLVTPITPDSDPDEDDRQVLAEDEEDDEDDLFAPVEAQAKEDEDGAEAEAAEEVAPVKDDEPEKEPEEDLPEETDEDEAEENDEGDEKEVVELPEEEVSAPEPEEAAEEEEPIVKAKANPPAPIAGDHILGEKVEYMPVGDIEINPLQPRRTFNEEELDDLTSSLEQHGLLQPLVVMPSPRGTGFQLVAGERRLRAAKQLKWDTVPCVVRRDVSGGRHRLELALIENVQRSNLNPIEEAMGYQRLNEEYGMTHEVIGQRVGRSRVGITNMIRLLQLPAEIQRGLVDGKISIGHARAILMIPDEEKQTRFYQHVIDEGLTVRKAENRARVVQRNLKLNDPLRRKVRGRPPLALKFEGSLQEKFGYYARVNFEVTKNRFEIVFHAFSEAEAEDLINKLLKSERVMEHVDQDVMED